MNEQYHTFVDGEFRGPYTRDDLQRLLDEYRIARGSNVRKSNGTWTTIAELGLSLTAAIPVATPSQQQQQGTMEVTLPGFIIGVGIIIVAAGFFLPMTQTASFQTEALGLGLAIFGAVLRLKK